MPELRPRVPLDAGRWAMSSFFRDYPLAVCSRPLPPSETPPRHLLQGPFSAHERSPKARKERYPCRSCAPESL